MELEKIPKNLKKLKESIKTKLEDYIETVNRENWYFLQNYTMDNFYGSIEKIM